jgi:hypothetical protein
MSQFATMTLPLSAADARPAVTDRVPAREEWVEAACKLLAYGSDVEQLNSESLADIVGVPESRLLQDFPEQNDFLTAVLARLLDEAAHAGDIATRDEEPSLFRMCRGIWATLNAHLRRPAIPVLWRVLQYHPAAQALEQQRAAAQLAALQAAFEAIGMPDAAGYARILNAMTMDIAEAEHISGQALPEHRRAICGYLRSLQPQLPA